MNSAHQPPHTPEISVIVPLYVREPQGFPAYAPTIRQFLKQFQDHPRTEIIISDSGPERPKNPVAELFDQLLEELPELEGRLRYRYLARADRALTRAEAMNCGARWARGAVLLFLHLDCLLPDTALAKIREAISNGAVAGGFLKAYTDKGQWSVLHLTQWYLNEVRTRRDKRVVGTNAPFMRRSLALRHPFRGQFLEDVEMSDWLRKTHFERLEILPLEVSVSSRKYRKTGEWRMILINATIMILYRLFRVPPKKLGPSLYHYDFPKDLSFWPQWLRRSLALIDQGQKDDARFDPHLCQTTPPRNLEDAPDQR